jgi:hypothetical protein
MKSPHGISKSYTGTYLKLKEEYFFRLNNLIPLEYQFLVTLGQTALKEGRTRAAIEATREALLHTENTLEIAFVYLSLARMYRMMIFMNNSRTELKKAFKVMGLSYPNSKIIAFIYSLRALFIILPKKASRKNRSDEYLERKKIASYLYEEAGLSSYYFRDSPVHLLHISLQARIIVYQIGPSFEMVNYLGATGTVFAIYKIPFLSKKYFAQSEIMAREVSHPYILIKDKIWKALSADYIYDPERSAELFENLLTEEKENLTPYDLILICVTLACNYNLRGQTKKAIIAVDNMITDYGKTCTMIFSSNKNFIEWHKIPSLSFYGKTDEIDRILVTSKVIFASADNEKWQLSQYLGNLLIHHYISRQHDFKEIENVLNRFEVINLSPKTTSLEARHYWVGKAYLYLDLYYRKEAEFYDVRNAIMALETIAQHPTIEGHYLVLKAHYNLYKKNIPAVKENIKKAYMLALLVHNNWVLYEIEKVNLELYALDRNYEEGRVLLKKTLSQLKLWGWQGCVHQLDRYKVLFQ